MADMTLAQSIFDDLCAWLDSKDQDYKKIEDGLYVIFTIYGEDIPMDFVMQVDAERQLIRLRSRLPLRIAEDKRMDLAIACCAATYNIMNGSFDFDITEGRIRFRMTTCFRDSRIGTELLEYMILCSFKTIDDYNDKFLGLAKGMININDFTGK